jgi:hypothetical protein
MLITFSFKAVSVNSPEMLASGQSKNHGIKRCIEAYKR